MSDLKLIALEEQDLAVLSTHLQDAVLKVGDIAYLPREHRFAALLNRFDWHEAATAVEQSASRRNPPAYARRRTALRFEQVKSARLKDIDLGDKQRVLNLLAIQFEPDGPQEPGGTALLIFAGDAAIRLEVEVIEAEMRDLGGVWATKSKPAHADDG